MENELVSVRSDEAGSYLLIGELIVRCWGCIEHRRAAEEMADLIRNELCDGDELMRETMERAEREE